MNITGTEKKIPFLDLSRQHKEVRSEINEAIGTVLSRGTFVLGDEVRAFETEWAEYCGFSECASVNSGTDALTIALLASGAVTPRQSDEVILPAITAGYTALAVLRAGAVPVFVDVNSDTLLIDLNAVEIAVTPRTKAIVPVHLFGQLVDVEQLYTLAARHDLFVLEDAAQAHGVWRRSNTKPAEHRTAAFSFYPTKNLGACGDGGAVVSSDPGLIERIRVLRQGGHPEAFSLVPPGLNSRLDEIQAAILRVKLRKLNEWNAQREHWASRYDRFFSNSQFIKRIRSDGPTANHLYVISVEERDRLRSFLLERGIETLIHYPEPLHLQKLFCPQAEVSRALLASESATKRILSLPLHSHSYQWEIEAVGNAVLEFERTTN